MNIEKKSFAMRCAALGCAIAIVTPSRAAAAVDEQQFNDVKEMLTNLVQKVQQQGQRIDQLEKAHDQDAQTHAQDQKTHEKDQQKIQELEQKLGETQQSVADAQQRASVTVPVEPMSRMPLDEATVNHNFSILGDAEVQFGRTTGAPAAFALADFAPIFLYRGGEKVLFEAGFDFILQNNAPNTNGYATTVNLSFAQLDYLLNDYVTLAAGDIFLPLGTYSERSAGWLNKIPGDPLARSILPSTGVGAELRGAIPLGQTGKMVNYSVWGVNGPSSFAADGVGNGNAANLDLGGNVGNRSDGTLANLHGKPSGGARLGFFMPFKPHYDLELGVSGQSGEWDNAAGHAWTAGVLDASVHLGSSLEVKGEYMRSSYGSDDLGEVSPEGWWVQGGYKLAGLNLDCPVLNNLEFVNRYEALHDGMGNQTRRYTIGYVYYLSNTLLFEGDYEFLRSVGVNQPKNALILQLSYGF
jgi:hypothetical protein